MFVYILKFTACLGIFLAFYKLFLERENMHQFKRFYLLAVVLLSISIPFITFTTYIEAQPVIGNMATTPFSAADTGSEMTKTPTNNLPIILWSIYGLGVLLFGIRFSVNLTHMILKIKRNPKQKSSRFINVLLKDLVEPHTFFSYIFLNKHKYETHQIPQEVMLHEQTHAKQKHSIDVLLIEFFQVVFWFNPLIYVTQKSIKLNHEFLADEAVLEHGVPSTNYQHILLSFSSKQQGSSLANAINYSSIKKRITVMKTKSSKHTTRIKSLVLLPLLAILIYSFSSTKTLEKSSISDSVTTNYTARSISIMVLDDGTYEVDGIKASKNTFIAVINQLHQDISPEIRNRIMNIHINDEKKVSDNDVWFIYNAFIEYGFHRIVTYNQEIIRAKGNTPFALSSSALQEHQDGASRELMSEYTRLAKHYNSQKDDNYRVKSKDVARLKYIYSLMSDKQRKSVEPFPEFPEPPPAPDAVKAVLPPPPPPPIPENATKEQKEKYQKVTAEYHKKHAVKDGKVSYNPPPPPPPMPPNATAADRAKYEEATKQYKLKTERVALKKEQAEKLRVEQKELARVKETQSKEEVAKLRTEKIAYLEAEEAKKAEKLRRVKEVQPPKPPKSPLDHVVDMAKKGATFYFEGKKISSDEAIKTLKRNPDLNIQTKNGHGATPVVNISSEPITIKSDND